ncbi:hypothetical protein NP233_g9711 [Leucocoprinus birnbaumii]|uniref:KOW domain-containing protein n=1 Tax=Leucocoprinus birnbaumii TaxID=56174 RepID=A0AAD5VJX9_9AGAR|nr:hypothetical protein NP233_g9711 [Leucocoprinus birnbaumii]
MTWYGDPDDDVPITFPQPKGSVQRQTGEAAQPSPDGNEAALQANVGPRRKRSLGWLDLEAESDGEESLEVEDDEDLVEGGDSLEDEVQRNPLAEEMQERYTRRIEDQKARRAALAASNASATGESEDFAGNGKPICGYSELSLPPQEGDWELWEVPVNVGIEEATVYRLFNRANDKTYYRGEPPRSIFSAPGTMGRIYIEAYQWSDVALLCKQIYGVRCNPAPFFSPKPHSWVRLKYRPYRNDLAFVHHVHERSMELIVALVPRIYYAPEKEASGGPPPKRWRKADLQARRPSKKLTITEATTQKRKKVAQVAQYSYMGRLFDASGYLLRIIPPHAYHHVAIHPTVEDLKPFLSCPTIPSDIRVHALQLASARELKEGDMVKLLSTIHVGSIGTIEGFAQTHMYVQLLDLPLKVQVPSHQIRRHFKTGDEVRIKAGEFCGYEGFVLDIDDQAMSAVVCNPKIHPGHVTAEVMYLEFAVNRIRLGQPPAPLPTLAVKLADLADRPDYGYLERLSVVVIKGPLKGLSGTVVAMSFTGIATIEMRAAYMQSRKGLQQVRREYLAYELQKNEWYTFDESDSLGITAKPIHNIHSLIQPSDTEHPRSKTPQPDATDNVGALNLSFWEVGQQSLASDKSYGSEPQRNTPQNLDTWYALSTSSRASDHESNPWNLTAKDAPSGGSLAGVGPRIPRDFWITSLPFLKKFGRLRLAIDSDKLFEEGAYDGKRGVYRNISGPFVQIYIHDDVQRQISVPYQYVKERMLPKGIRNTDTHRPLSKKARLQSDVTVLQGKAEPNKDDGGSNSMLAAIDQLEERAERLEGVEEVERSQIVEGEESNIGSRTQRSKGDQAMSVRMAPFTPEVLNLIQGEIIGREYDNRVGQKCSCDSGGSTRYRCLECFHSIPVSYDYYQALRMHTNAAFPDLVEDRYSSMVLVMRFWRTLSLRRWAGLEHKIYQILTHRRKYSLAVYCPACPEIGFTVDDAAVLAAPESDAYVASSQDKQGANNLDSHLFTLFLSLDGNFQLQRKRKNNDPNDVALNDGHAYFVEHSAFKAHMESVKKEKEKEACRVKFKDAAVTGVVGCQCARHLTWVAQGMVDLDKGEAYAKTDYALAHALGTEALRQRWIMVSYDIWCQYHVNLSRRFREHFPWLENVVEKMRGAVPKMHIEKHKWECQINHSFVYKPYSAMTYGEGIESTWSEQNHAASSTKELNEGHRHDTLDDFNGYWNWCKVIKIGSSLSAQAKRWHKELHDHKISFETFTRAVPQEILAEWMINIEASKSNPSLFELKDRGTSELKAYAELVGEESDEDIAVCSFIRRGLELEDLMSYAKTRFLSDNIGDEDGDEDSPSSLSSSLQDWRSLQLELFPCLRPLPPLDENCLEHTELRLPSAYTARERDALGLQEATRYEIRLRRGRAYDILRALRDWIHRSDYVRVTKKLGPIGRETRSYGNSGYKEAEEQKDRLLARYQETYRILEVLEVTTDLNPLTRDDLWVKSPFELHKKGDSSKHNPWYWSIGKPDDMTTDSWLLEVERARWFRERALVDRLQEELELLNEEFRRSTLYFRPNVLHMDGVRSEKSESAWFLCLRSPARSNVCSNVQEGL